MKYKDIKIGSNRSFGIVFFVVFFLISIYPLINNESIRIWSLVVSLIFLVLGIINSNVLSPLNKLWFKFGILLGKIIYSEFINQYDTNTKHAIDINQSSGTYILSVKSDNYKNEKLIIID